MSLIKILAKSRYGTGTTKIGRHTARPRRSGPASKPSIGRVIGGGKRRKLF